MHYDAIIVGGSYAGLSAALQLARARRTVCVIDAGQPRNRFAAAAHGFFGQDGAEPGAMISGARDQVLAYPTVTLVNDEAVSAQKEANGTFSIGTASGVTMTSSGVVLASGARDVLPEIPGIAERWGASVLHCPFCHGFEFSGRALGVLATRPLMSHHARLIKEWGPTTLFLNGPDDMDDATRSELQAADITVEPAVIAALEGEGRTLTGIRLDDHRLIPLDAIFISPQRKLNPLASQLGCELDEGPTGPVVRTDALRRTTVPGVYAAGDVMQASGNATTASADGVLAALALFRDLIFGATI